jgi:hypothetical protein
MTPIRSDEIFHTGVKGMKHGRRQYQNKDGSLTPLGRIHYGVGKAREKADPVFTQSIKTGKGKENQSPAEKITKDTSRLVNETKNATGALKNAHNNLEATKQDSKLSKQVSQMSDQELRQAINRLQMEQQYKNLNTKYKRTGYDKAMEVLSVTGSVVGIAAAGASIVSTVNTLRKKG